MLLAPLWAWAQACTTTLSAGAAVGTAISSAAAGSTICLSNGNYSGFTLNGVTKNPRVTVRAVTAGGATFTSAINIGSGTNGLTIDGVNTAGINITGASTQNITIRNGNASNGTIVVDGLTASAPNVLFENLVHINQDNSGFCRGGGFPCVGAGAYWFSYSGRSTPVATIRGAFIDGGCADGIQSGVPFILEFSIIQNKLVGTCPNDPHTDATQFYGGPFVGTVIRHNYYFNNAQVIAAYDGVEGVLIEHNLLDPGTSEPRPCQIELYSDDSSIVRNNTIITRGTAGEICLDKKTAFDNGFGTQIYNNFARQVTQNSGSTASVISNNVLVAGGSGSNITGSPTFKGSCGGTLTQGASWAGCALASGSAGKGAGTDGKDVGTRYYGLAAPVGSN